ncbi:MAG: enoyl-CoA hydratase-related protein, partial [Candidatus Puniceispirillaceae bacterium]
MAIVAFAGVAPAFNQTMSANSNSVRHYWNGLAAVIEIDRPPVNAINHDIRAGLVAALAAIAADAEVDRIILAGAGDIFAAGADAGADEYGATQAAFGGGSESDEGHHQYGAGATQVALTCLAPLGDSSEVRGKTLMLLHRMTDTLHAELLGFLDGALPQLLSAADSRELVELVTLINQLVLKF